MLSKAPVDLDTTGNARPERSVSRAYGRAAKELPKSALKGLTEGFGNDSAEFSDIDETGCAGVGLPYAKEELCRCPTAEFPNGSSGSSEDRLIEPYFSSS